MHSQIATCCATRLPHHMHSPCSAPAAAPSGRRGCSAAAHPPTVAPAPAEQHHLVCCIREGWEGQKVALSGRAASSRPVTLHLFNQPQHCPHPKQTKCRRFKLQPCLCMIVAGQVSASSWPVCSSRWCALASSSSCRRTRMPPPCVGQRGGGEGVKKSSKSCRLHSNPVASSEH